jgi:hypothetical protein
MSSRRRRWEQRLASAYVLYIALVAGVLVVTGIILLVMAIVSWRGRGDDGERIDFSDFGTGLLGLGEADYRQFFATCRPGRLTVVFKPDDEIRITRAESDLIASLNSEEASVGCSGGLEDARGRGFFVRGLRRVVRPATLECLTQEPLRLVVSPIFRHETVVNGGQVVLGMPVPNLHPRALILSVFTEDGHSDVWYRPGRCRVSQS